MRGMGKVEKLEKILRECESAVVAFSGGVDSSFLLKVARDVLPRENVLAVTAASATYTRSELAQAKRFAKSLGVRHSVIFTDEMKNKNFTRNPADRCYYCKKELFRDLKNIARRGEFRFVLDASNLDDKKDYRPGGKAKKDFRVRSPLEEAGIKKSDLRRYSKKMGLETWDLPAMPCLASRVPYGEKICKSTLERIEKAEGFIRGLGVKHVRVRHHAGIARVEVDKKDIKRFFKKKFCDKIVRRLKRLGFNYIVLDMEGYRTGSLNEVLKK
ncbi:MAG: ATP-dependent sacrificial sulfur transferase LarE [Candidatus Omnitrophica bacterium]|nr:ATP-dependent sacrificial sulfur transferase LarE [Candidatus Omnitrophota bacterium]